MAKPKPITRLKQIGNLMLRVDVMNAQLAAANNEIAHLVKRLGEAHEVISKLQGTDTWEGVRAMYDSYKRDKSIGPSALAAVNLELRKPDLRKTAHQWSDEKRQTSQIETFLL